MAALRLGSPALRARLMDLYLSLNCCPEVPEVLRDLKVRGMRLAILSNGDHVLSVEEVGVFKPHPSAYRLAVERLAIDPKAGCFVSSNGWDACAAQDNGFRAGLVQPVWPGAGTRPRSARGKDFDPVGTPGHMRVQ